MTRVHPFEANGLGQAPFRFVGYSESKFQAAPGEPIRAGSSCDHCGTAIMGVFRVRSSDGREFKVGCDCIRKVYADFDGSIPAEFRRAIAQIDRRKREAKRAAAWDAATARANAAKALLEANTALFADAPHPNAYFASKGLTRRDYLLFLLGAGQQGRITAAREIEKAVPVSR